VINNETVKFGEHLIFDAYGCPLDRLNNPQLCLDVLNKLVELGDMQKLHDPYIIKADSNEVLGGKDPGGYSAFVMIYESHISVHTFARRGFVTLDVYSCKPFSSEGMISYLKEVFQPKDFDVLKFDRGLKYPVDNIY
jgi:S-adenosylmethionine decarboxylase